MKLYKEASLMMLPTSVKDGKLYSIFPQPKPLSGELITNGDFDTGSDWTKDSGWTINNGKATYDAVSNVQDIRQEIAFESGKNYKVTFDISDVDEVSGKKARFALWTISNASEVVFNYTELDNGSYVYYYTATNGSALVFVALNNANGGSFSIDNISVVEVDQAPADFDFSRGSNLAATRINEQGLIEKGRENLFTYSNEFTNSAWNSYSNGLTRTASNITDPDGGTNAWEITTTATNEHHRLGHTMTSGKVKTISFYAKANGYEYVRVWAFSGGNTNSNYFHLSGEGATGGNGQLNIKSIESVGNGWYRCQCVLDPNNNAVVVISPAPDASTAQGTATYLADGASGIYLYNAQLEVGLVATDYIESGATTGKAGVLEDLPRLNWGNCPSLLLEPQRQNLVAYSEYLEESDTLGDAQILNTTDTTPEGTSNAKVLAYDGGTNQHYLSNVPSVTSGQTYTFSVFLKKKEVRYAALIFLNDFRGRFFDLETGSILGTIGSGSLVDSKIEDYGNGWYRCSITDTATSTTKFSGVYLCHSATSFGGFTPTNTDGFYIYGAQLEQGSYPTSYIPTHGTSVTRSVETARGLFNGDSIFDTNWTAFCELIVPNVGGDLTGAGFVLKSVEGSISTADRVAVLVHESNSQLEMIFYDGTTQQQIPFNYTFGDTLKIAIRSDSAYFINGTKYTTTMVLQEPVEIGYGRAGQADSSVGETANIIQTIIFPTALSDNECINLTTI